MNCSAWNATMKIATFVRWSTSAAAATASSSTGKRASVIGSAAVRVSPVIRVRVGSRGPMVSRALLPPKGAALRFGRDASRAAAHVRPCGVAGADCGRDPRRRRRSSARSLFVVCCVLVRGGPLDSRRTATSTSTATYAHEHGVGPLALSATSSTSTRRSRSRCSSSSMPARAATRTRSAGRWRCAARRPLVLIVASMASIGASRLRLAVAAVAARRVAAPHRPRLPQRVRPVAGAAHRRGAARVRRSVASARRTSCSRSRSPRRSIPIVLAAARADRDLGSRRARARRVGRALVRRRAARSSTSRSPSSGPAVSASATGCS